MIRRRYTRHLLTRCAKGVEALPRGLLGRACQYALKLWKQLELIMSDGRIEVDNNWVENGMRPIALGRKNWLHIGSEEAGTHVARRRLWWRHANAMRFASKSISDLCCPVSTEC